MAQRALLLIGDLVHARNEWRECGQFASKLYEYPSGTRDEFLSKCRSGAFDGTYALYRSNDSNKYTGNFDDELLEALPKSLKFICHNGAGYDNIDIAACTKRGIAVSSTPVAVNDATADVAMFLILGALRNITQSFQAVRQGMLKPSECIRLMLTSQGNGAESSPLVTTLGTRHWASWEWAASVRPLPIAPRRLG